MPNINHWTVLLYMAGDNDLAEHMVKALHDLDKVRLEHLVQPKSNPELWIKQACELLETVTILAQFDPSGVGRPTLRFDISGILRRLWGSGSARDRGGDSSVT